MRLRVLVRLVSSTSLVLTAAAVLVPALAGRPAASLSSLTITGRGFGHGMGLSQWGAEERARAGQSYAEILAFYYPGTMPGTIADRQVRVLVREAAKVSVGSRAPFTVRDARGRTAALPAGLYPVTTAFRLAGHEVLAPFTLLPGRRPILAGGAGYHGTLTLVARGRRVMVVNRLALEDYVRDVVSVEAVGSWPQDALRAQAVASRTYALASLRPRAAFDFYADDRSQNYRGLRREFTSASRATAATTGQILLYRGAVAYTVFSASNGGMTNDTTGQWPVPPLPYLVSRPDPFDARGPDSTWGPVGIDTTRLYAAFPKLPPSLTSFSLTTSHSGRAATITFVGQGGTSVTIDAYTFQQRLGLRSTYFTTIEGS